VLITAPPDGSAPEALEDTDFDLEPGDRAG
jgi:hypothetical protein